MLIIIEGPDGASKTTLVDEVERQLGQYGEPRRLKRGVPDEHPLVEYELELDDYVPNGTQDVVADRWHWSELVYGPIYRQPLLLDLAMARHIEAYLRSRGAFVVYLTAERDVLVRRAEERGEAGSRPQDRGATKVEHMDALIRGYENVYQWSNLPSMRIDTTHTPLDRFPGFAADIVALARLIEQDTLVETHAGYIGPPTPRVLLVGDKRQPGRRNHEHRAPFAPYPDSCGRYLLNALPPGRWRDVGLVNATEDGDLRDLHRALGGPNVVALGRVAHEVLDLDGVVHGAVPHPQYWRRFHHWKNELYGQLLDAAAFDGQQTFSWPQPNPIPEDLA